MTIQTTRIPASETIRNLMEASGSRIMSVVFLKKDGTKRTMPFNPQHRGEIKGTGNPIKDKEKKENIFKVMDLSLNPPQWRCFDARTVLYARVGGDRIDFRQEELADGPRAC